MNKRNLPYILLLWVVLSIFVVMCDEVPEEQIKPTAQPTAQPTATIDLIVPIVSGRSHLYLPVISKHVDCKLRLGVSVDDNTQWNTNEGIHNALYGAEQNCVLGSYKWNVPINNQSQYNLIRRCKDISYQLVCWSGGIVERNGFSLSSHVAENPCRHWIVGNEPDNFNEVDGDSLTPKQYAQMLIDLSAVIKGNDPCAKIIWGQTTFPVDLDIYNDQFPYGSGTGYLSEAMRHVNPIGLVDSFSVHNYHWAGFENWKSDMLHFEAWLDSIDYGGTDIYLTEYGKLNTRSASLAVIQSNVHVWLESRNRYKAWWFIASCVQDLDGDGGLIESCNGSTVNLNQNGADYKSSLQYIWE